ncbi:MAG: integrating conjugative element protein [Tatlockia sp.]|nr:integrating conjugative element protein [Tatlockia sp.]
MKTIVLIISLLVISAGYAIDMERFLKEAQEQLTEESLKLDQKLDARLPVFSQATAGKVENRKIEHVSFSEAIFIIGDDPISREWLKKHARELEEKHALGFVTNIRDSAHLQTLQALTKAPLLPANIDDLMTLFKESHYPLVFFGSELWQ